MAIKKNLFKQDYTYNDMFDTAAALDSGELKSVKAGFSTMSAGNTESSTDLNATSSTQLGSILGQYQAIEANKKRRLEQQAGRNAGITNSILGGGSF